MNTTTIKLCECGCGNPAPIAKKTKSYRGQVAGQALRFISGHNTRTLSGEEQSRRGHHNTGEKLRGTGSSGWYIKENYKHKHRTIAEQIIGRPLLPGEVVHHEDGDKTNFAPENIKVFINQSAHMKYHCEQGTGWGKRNRRAKV